MSQFGQLKNENTKEYIVLGAIPKYRSVNSESILSYWPKLKIGSEISGY
jgi:hypothetical protein